MLKSSNIGKSLLSFVLRWSQYIVQTGLEHSVLLIQPPYGCDYRQATPWLAHMGNVCGIF